MVNTHKAVRVFVDFRTGCWQRSFYKTFMFKFSHKKSPRWVRCQRRKSFHFRHFSFDRGLHLARLPGQFTWCFPSLLARRFGCFLQSLFSGRFLGKTNKQTMNEGLQNNNLKQLNLLEHFEGAAANSTDLQFGLLSRRCYGNQLWDFFLFLLLLVLLYRGFCLLYVIWFFVLCLLCGCWLKTNNVLICHVPLKMKWGGTKSIQQLFS